MPSPLGQGVGEAVAEIQPGCMPPFAVPAPAADGPGGKVGVYGHNVDLRVTEKAVDNVLPGWPEPCLDDDAQFDADGGRHEPGEGTFKMSHEFVAPWLAEDDCHGR